MNTNFRVLFASLKFERDERSLPDVLRRGRFHSGWRDGSNGEREYTEETLKRLTWTNLGYRFGRQLGWREDGYIYRAYEALALQYRECRFDEMMEGVIGRPGRAVES